MARPGLPGHTKKVLTDPDEVTEARTLRVTPHLREKFVDTGHDMNSIIIDTIVKIQDPSCEERAMAQRVIMSDRRIGSLHPFGCCDPAGFAPCGARCKLLAQFVNLVTLGPVGLAKEQRPVALIE